MTPGTSPRIALPNFRFIVTYSMQGFCLYLSLFCSITQCLVGFFTCKWENTEYHCRSMLSDQDGLWAMPPPPYSGVQTVHQLQDYNLENTAKSINIQQNNVCPLDVFLNKPLLSG